MFVEWISDSENQPVRRVDQRKDLRLAQKFRAGNLEDGSIGEIARSDQRESELARDGLCDVLLMGQAQFRQDLFETLLSFRAKAQGSLGGCLVEFAVGDQPNRERSFKGRTILHEVPPPDRGWTHTACASRCCWPFAMHHRRSDQRSIKPNDPDTNAQKCTKGYSVGKTNRSPEVVLKQGAGEPAQGGHQNHGRETFPR